MRDALEILPLTARDVPGWSELLAISFDRSPAEMSALRGRRVKLPYTRSPYYLTLKLLRDDLLAAFFHFDQWDCIGGDIL